MTAPGSFLEVRLNDAVARGSHGGPIAKRLKAYAGSGKLSQDFRWSRPLHRYDISHGIKVLEDFESVRAMWYVVFFGGPHRGFRFKDWNDYRCTQANSILQFVDGTDWQLGRRYVVRAGALVASYSRIIQKPVDGTVVVYRTRAGVVSAATATVAPATGLVSISGHAEGDTYTWAGEFDVPVTFQDDAMDGITLDGVEGNELLGLPSIPLEEIRL